MKKLLSLLICFGTFILSAQSGMDSLLTVLKTAKEDTNKVKLLFQLSENCDQKDILKYALPAADLAGKLDYKRGRADALNNIGFYYDHVEYDTQKALECYTEAAAIHEEIGNSIGLISALINIGIIYSHAGFTEKALSTFMKALKISEQSKDRMHEARCLTFIASMYTKQGLLEDAISENMKALKIQEEIKDERNIPTSLSNIAGLYRRMKQFKKAEEYFLRALEISRKTTNKGSIAVCLHELGGIYFETGERERGLVSCLESLKLSEELNDRRAMAYCYASLGTYYFNLGRKEEGIRSGQKALNLGIELKNPEIIRDASENLARLYEVEKKYHEAYLMHKLFKQMADSTYNIEIRNEVVKKQLQYDFDKKERELKYEQERTEAGNRAEKKTLLLIITGLSALIVFALAFGWLFIRQKRILADQKALQLEQKLLRVQMNPHFIFNCLQAIQNYVSDQKAIKYLGSFGTLARMVLENSRLEAVPLHKEVTLLRHYLELQKLLNKELFDYTLTVAPGLDSDAVKIPPMLLQPFIENAIEHGFGTMQRGGQLHISFYTEADHLVLEVSDNGVGFSGAQRSKGTSLATAITQERIQLLNQRATKKASFTVSEVNATGPNPGVRVCFHLPL